MSGRRFLPHSGWKAHTAIPAQTGHATIEEVCWFCQTHFAPHCVQKATSRAIRVPHWPQNLNSRDVNDFATGTAVGWGRGTGGVCDRGVKGVVFPDVPEATLPGVAADTGAGVCMVAGAGAGAGGGAGADVDVDSGAGVSETGSAGFVVAVGVTGEIGAAGDAAGFMDAVGATDVVGPVGPADAVGAFSERSVVPWGLWDCVCAAMSCHVGAVAAGVALPPSAPNMRFAVVVVASNHRSLYSRYSLPRKVRDCW